MEDTGPRPVSHFCLQLFPEVLLITVYPCSFITRTHLKGSGLCPLWEITDEVPASKNYLNYKCSLSAACSSSDRAYSWGLVEGIWDPEERLSLLSTVANTAWNVSFWTHTLAWSESQLWDKEVGPIGNSKGSKTMKIKLYIMALKVLILFCIIKFTFSQCLRMARKTIPGT